MQPLADETGQRRPVGIFAALLALAIALATASAGQAYAVRLAGRYLRSVAGRPLPIKWESLTFQRAAFADGHLLPIYGSSELYCCGDPVRPTELFQDEPTGFDAFAVGRAGTADLFFMETFAALGGELRGKKLVISDSPPWFFGLQGMGPKPYAGNFSPEIAEMFAFDAPISLDLREQGARRMLAYPDTLRDQPLLRAALTDLADPTPLHLVEYLALYPIGRIDSWVKQLQDAGQTVHFIEDNRSLRPDTPVVAGQPDWSRLLMLATRIAEQRDTTNPFGFPDGTYRTLVRKQPQVRQALRLFCAGKTNRDGQLFGEPVGWEERMSQSAEWTDLRLELRVLRELGARPLVWSLTMPGFYDDYTNLSAPARRVYYAQYRRLTSASGAPSLEFQAHDEDRYFLTDTGAHFSPRGWVFADRALDLFWHDATPSQIRAALVDLNRRVPPAGPPNRREYCSARP